ncbi:MAG: hypothetical protein NTY19_36095 [Planctomycetota bacterium]|nr:hypothetical protein [Planctomycetota bacterium]
MTFLSVLGVRRVAMPDSSQPNKPSGLAAIARRVAVWTSNLLVTGIVLVAVLTFGRQFTSWWTSPSGVDNLRLGQGIAMPILGQEQALQILDVGDGPLALGRRTVTGNRAAVLMALRQACRAAATAGPRTARVPGPREVSMLRRTAELPPVEQAPGQWKLYQLEGPLPMVVVVQDGCGPTATDGSRAAAAGAAGHEAGSTAELPQGETSSRLLVAEPGPRVLSWGLAFPLESETLTWTLFTCTPGEPAEAAGLGRQTGAGTARDSSPAGSSRPAIPAVDALVPQPPEQAATGPSSNWFAWPTPPGGRRLLALQAEGGGGLASFAGAARRRDWLDFFDAWFEQQGWSASPSWQSSGGLWQRRFEHASQQLVAQITVEDGGQLRALMTVARR